MRVQRRKWKRVPAGFDVTYRIEEQCGVASAIDVSSGGIFVGLDSPPRVGDRVYLTFTLPGVSACGPVRVIGEVIRTVPPGTKNQPGFGVSFIATQPDSRKALGDFIRGASLIKLDDADLRDIGGEIIEVEPRRK